MTIQYLPDFLVSAPRLVFTAVTTVASSTATGEAPLLLFFTGEVLTGLPFLLFCFTGVTGFTAFVAPRAERPLLTGEATC